MVTLNQPKMQTQELNIKKKTIFKAYLALALALAIR